MSDQPEIEILSTGVRGRLIPVPAYMIDALVAEVQEPKPPKQFIDSKGREEENPLDPEYLKAIEDANRLRGLQTMKAMIMFGVELVDGVPDPESWLPKLQWLEKSSVFSLEDYDLDDPHDLEFVYKAFIAVGNLDIMKLTVMSGMTEPEVQEAMRGFRGTPQPDTDMEGEPTE